MSAAWSPANPDRDVPADSWSAASQKDRQDVLSVLALEATKARDFAENCDRYIGHLVQESVRSGRDTSRDVVDRGLVFRYRARAAAFDAAVNVLRGR